MAANYWDSTQAKYWTFTKAELVDLRKQLVDSNQHVHNKYPLPDRRLLSIYIQQNLTKLARRMSLRQQALATAQVYIKRFYLRVEIRKTNPYLIMATAVYLGCKMEECPQHIRLLLGEAARQWPELGITETSKIGECEFALISTLSSRLILHHAYRTLTELASLFGLSHEEQTLAHNIINDSYNTDLPLLYPPHIIAITSIFLAVVLRPAGQPSGLQNFASSSSSSHPVSPLHSPGGQQSGGAPSGNPAMSANAAQNALLGGLSGLKQAGPKLGKLVDWLAESKVDMSSIVDATQEMVSLYEVWEQYNERACKDAITKFMQNK
ncbi:RNA polymerase II holoenzyme cyclin-like subunit [Vermiconidia calcicola]|uniref:RNA polymerase II holoenzyme cyclin-like subunit n=1 Tax=Vermiconidia calcicola TaxID=1690605 RepID=A0ACC3MZA1_9PEZI|nr:RNA polymerase II holoenzyme cyclin-like subunit [Vermiconidia calcicola]